jgi:hypothetical protein
MIAPGSVFYGIGFSKVRRGLKMKKQQKVRITGGNDGRSR